MELEAIQLADDLSYEDWFVYVFDREDRDWHFELDATFWDATRNSDRALAHLTRLFQTPYESVKEYTPYQIGSGLNYLVSSSCSDHAFVMLDFSSQSLSLIQSSTRCLRRDLRQN